MTEWISEAIVPHGGALDTGAMARGEPGLPRAFVWRDAVHEIQSVRRQWKQSDREGSAAQGQLYLRRHYYELCMNNGSVWTVYFLRQTPRSGKRQARWFLYATGPDV